MHRGVVHDTGESPGEIYVFPHLKRLFIEEPIFFRKYDELHKKFLNPDFEYEKKELRNDDGVYFESEFLRQKKELIEEYLNLIKKRDSIAEFINTEGWARGTLVEVDHEDEKHEDEKHEDEKPEKKSDMQVIDPLPFYNPRRGGGGFTDFEKIAYNLVFEENFFKI